MLLHFLTVLLESVSGSHSGKYFTCQEIIIPTFASRYDVYQPSTGMPRVGKDSFNLIGKVNQMIAALPFDIITKSYFQNDSARKASELVSRKQEETGRIRN